MSFPLPFVPRLSYKSGARYFGARRSKGRRRHAGCDLIAPVGTEILAVDHGFVTRGPYDFYHGTYALEVEHDDFVVRYGEIRGAAPGIRVGTEVAAGQVIAYVGRMHVDSMLHFEMYSGTLTGRLTQRDNPPYQRRADLIDPTPYLDQWAADLTGSRTPREQDRSCTRR